MSLPGHAVLRYPAPADTAWMADAACTPHVAWTTEHKPAIGVLNELRAICDHCPVLAECANHALTKRIHGAVYAGVWLPHRHSAEWLRARETLHRKTRRYVTVTKGPQ